MLDLGTTGRATYVSLYNIFILFPVGLPYVIVRPGTLFLLILLSLRTSTYRGILQGVYYLISSPVGPLYSSSPRDPPVGG